MQLKPFFFNNIKWMKEASCSDFPTDTCYLTLHKPLSLLQLVVLVLQFNPDALNIISSSSRQWGDFNVVHSVFSNSPETISWAKHICSFRKLNNDNDILESVGSGKSPFATRTIKKQEKVFDRPCRKEWCRWKQSVLLWLFKWHKAWVLY